MAVRKLKQSWWVDFRANHTRYRQRSPENSRAGALAYEAHLRQQLARGTPIGKAAVQRHTEPTFAEFARQWLVEYVAANNKVSEQVTKRYILEATLIPCFGSSPVTRITAHDIERYKAQQVQSGLANKTIRNHLTVLHKCLVTAYDWLGLDGAPPRIQWPKCPPGRTDYLTPEECKCLIENSDGTMHAMILTALRTGMRQGELRGLQWSSIDWQTRSLAVRHSLCEYQKALVSPKSNRARHIPLDAELHDILARRRRTSGTVFTDSAGAPYRSKRLNHELALVCRVAGMRKITWHVLRHTFATHLAMRGVPLPTVQALLGHSSITTTMRYAHVAPSTLRTAIDMLSDPAHVSTDFGQPVVNRWIASERADAMR